MIACPNKSSQEWKNLVNTIGEFEAFREYMKLGNGNIPSLETISSLKKEQNFSEESLFGLDNNPNKLEFQAVTISAVSDFISSIGVDQRFVSEFLAKDGSVIEGALAAANFIDKTVDIIDDVNKRPEAWNKLPEEAAHWWYRLLRNDSILKGELWMSHKTALKADELYKTKYGSLEGINKPEDLTEEAIGHLIAESIKRIEDKKGSKKDYSFLQKIIKWVNKILAKFTLGKQDPFEVAAMKILSSDLSDLLTVEEYTNLTKNSNLQIHDGVIYDQSYLEKKLDENLVDKDKYVHKIKTSEQSSESIASLIKSITTFRKNNPKLQIATDKGYGPSDIIFFPLANGKTGAFVKSTGNFAFKDFYHLLDYKNRLNIGRRTYYLLTDNFTTGTQREFYEQDQNEFARKKAAKEGRYIITPTNNPYLSPRIKKTFFDYIENLKEKFADVPEMLMAVNRQKLLLDQYDKKIEEEFKKEYAKAIERFKNIDSDPLIRKSAIDNLLKNLKGEFVTEYKELFEKLPTIVLVNMNLQREKGYTYGIEEQDLIEYNARPFRYDPFLQEFSPNPGNELHIIPNTSSIIPTGYEQLRGDRVISISFKQAIETVNKKIIDNTLNTELADYEKEKLRSIGYKSFVNNVKTKSMAVALEILKSPRGYEKAKLFYKQIQQNKSIVQEKLKQKLLSKFPEEAKLINEYTNILYPIEINYLDNQDKILNIINSRLKSGNKINIAFEKDFATKVEDMPKGGTYFVKDGMMYYTAIGTEPGWYLDYGYSGSFEGEYLFDNTRKLTDEEAIEMYNENASMRKDENIKIALLRIGEFIYDSARYSPDLTAFNTIINSVRNEFTGAQYQNITDQQLFSQIYSALILKSGSIYDILKSEYSSDIIQERVNNLVNWITGGTAVDVLQEKLDNMYEFIKGKDTIVKSYELNLSYNPKLGLYDDFKYDRTVDDLIKAQASELMLDREVLRAVRNSEIGLLKLESKNLPEGFDVQDAKKLDFPNLTSFPQDFKFTHRIDYVNMPEVSLNMLPKDFRDYIESGLLSVNLKDFKKEKSKIRPEEAVDQVFISKTKSSLLSQKEAKYSFDHTAALYYDQNSFPYYTLSAPGKKFRVEFSAPEDSPFPKELYEAFKLHHGGMKMKADNAIGWFSGTVTNNALYVTEVQSDLLQRTYELSNKWLDEKGYSSNHKFRKFTGLKSKLENYYNGWIYVFTGTGLQVTLKNNPDIKEIYIPTSEYYKNNVSATSPYQYYDKIASVFPSATKTRDGKFYKIDRSDLFAGISKDTKGYYDVIMKSAISAGLKEQKEITPDLDSDQNLAKDILSTLSDIDILSDYLKSEQGINHINELQDWIEKTYSDEKPVTGDTQGGELVDSYGNVIDDGEESDEDRKVQDLINQSNEINQRKAKLDVDWLLEELSAAIQNKDVNRQNFIKKLLEQATKEQDRLFGIEQKPTVQFNRTVSSEEEQKQEIGGNIVTTLASRLSENLGVKFNIITPEQARALTEKTETPWNGEKAFYFNGETYFLAEGFTSENVLHEFGHPLIDAIYANNKKLFDNLYDVISNTEEGNAIIEVVKEKYPKYKETDELFKKEVMTRALTKEAMSETTTKGFKEFIKKVLFAIKQTLRKVFGMKVNVDKLSVNTSLTELAKMLKSDKFDIDTDVVSEKDVVQYTREVKDYVDALKDVEDHEISKVVERFYLLTSNQLQRIKRNKNYIEAQQALVARKGVLTGIKATLDQTRLSDKEKALLTDLEIRKKNSTNFVHAIIQLEILVKKIQDHIDEIVKTKDTKEGLNSIFYYDLLVKNWSSFIKEANETLMDNGMDESSILGTTMSSIQTGIEKIKRKINKAYMPGLVDVLKDSLNPLIEGIDNYYKNWISDLEKKKAPESLIEKKKKEWEEAKLTDEKLKGILEGKYGDTSYFSAYLEAATNSPDPIVGGFAMFLKNNYNIVEAEFQRDMNSFIREVNPLLKKAGYSRTNFTDLMNKLVFEDDFTYYDIKTGKKVTKKVLTFLNEFKNRNVHLEKFKSDIETAAEAGNNEEVDRIIKEQRQHLKDYFHQEYADEYYEREDIYDSFEGYDDLKKLAFDLYGVDESKATEAQKNEVANLYKRLATEAYRRKYEIINEIKQIDALQYDESTFESDLLEKKYLWRKYSQLASSLDLNGKTKEGEEKLIAAIEKKYRKESNKFFEWTPIEGQFEFSLRQFEQNLIDSGVAKDSDEYKNKRDFWIKNNTVISYTKDFYNERNEILARLKELMAKVPESVRSQIDSTDEIEQQLSIAYGFRDDNGQIIGTELSDKAKEKLKSLQEAIIKKRNSMAGFSGLTKFEMEEMVDLYNKAKARSITPEESDRLTNLINKKDKIGVNKALKAEIQRQYSLLSDIQSKEATDYYLQIVDNWFQKMGEPAPTIESVDGILRPEQYVRLFSLDSEFEKWFKENHVAKEIFDKALGQNIIVFERIFAWSRTRPTDEKYFEKTELSDGEIILGKPNLTYFYRQVKDSYIDDKGNKKQLRTPKIVGKTVDNRGNWLPKTVAEGAKDDLYENKEYYKLKKNDPAAFNVLEKMKEYHLKFQEDSPRESRLYLEAPRYRSMAIEMLKKPKEKLNKGKQLLLNIRSKFFTAKDNYEEGLNFEPSALVSANMFDEEIRKIPVTGLYDLKPDEVSRNFLDGMMQYRHSVLHQKKLIELNPVAQAFQNVLADPKNAVNEDRKISKWYYKVLGLVVPIKKKGESIRMKAVKNLYEREFEGKHQSIDLINRYPGIQKARQSMAFISSLGYFALNIPSAFKNKIAAQEQGLIEAAGGRFLNLSSYTIGKGMAFKMLATHSTEVYATKNKSLESQLIQIFNPVQDMFEHMVKSQFGRSVASDISNLSILMAPRKFLQTKSTLDVFCGMLYHIKVKQTINGKTTEIPYSSAWEIRNGQIELKAGIDEEWAAGGKKFNEFKNRLHELVNRIEGTYSRMDQPELNRNFFFQSIIFMKKYFTSMFMNQIAKRRPSAALGTISTGNYANLIYIMKGMWDYKGKYYMWMNSEEKAALQKVVAQVVSLFILNMIIGSWFFGYDEGDKDRFRKLREKSGDMLSDDFRFGGWMENQALIVSLGVLTETGTWYNPKLFANTVRGIPDPSALLKTGFTAPFEIMNNLYKESTGDGTAYYKKDVGPYSWQKEGGSKAINDLAEIFGFTGATLSPELKGIKSIEATRKGIFK